MVQMKIEFTLLFALTFDLHTFVNLMLSNCVSFSSSNSFFKNYFGLNFSVDLFYCPLEGTFSPKYCVPILKPSAALLGPKNGTIVPSPSWIFTCGWGKGWILYTTKALWSILKVFGKDLSWQFVLLGFSFLLLGQRSLWRCQVITMLTANWM